MLKLSNKYENGYCFVKAEFDSYSNLAYELNIKIENKNIITIELMHIVNINGIVGESLSIAKSENTTDLSYNYYEKTIKNLIDYHTDVFSYDAINIVNAIKYFIDKLNYTLEEK